MADQDNEFVQLKLRVRASLRTRLEEAANHGSLTVSVNQEAVGRLERSFETPEAPKGDHLDQLLDGDAALRSEATTMVAIFARAGQFAAEAKGHPKWTTAEWMADRGCYRAAIWAVVNTLRGPIPTEEWEEMARLHRGQSL